MSPCLHPKPLAARVGLGGVSGIPLTGLNIRLQLGQVLRQQLAFGDLALRHYAGKLRLAGRMDQAPARRIIVRLRSEFPFWRAFLCLVQLRTSGIPAMLLGVRGRGGDGLVMQFHAAQRWKGDSDFYEPKGAKWFRLGRVRPLRAASGPRLVRL